MNQKRESQEGRRDIPEREEAEDKPTIEEATTTIYMDDSSNQMHQNQEWVRGQRGMHVVERLRTLKINYTQHIHTIFFSCKIYCQSITALRLKTGGENSV